MALQKVLSAKHAFQAADFVVSTNPEGEDL